MDIFLPDLDGSGSDEIYIIMTFAGSGGYETVLGFASKKDESLSGINFPEIQEGDKNFVGYVGHGILRTEDRTRVRIFPIYQQSHTNQVRPAEQDNWFMVYTREKRYGNLRKKTQKLSTVHKQEIE